MYNKILEKNKKFNFCKILNKKYLNIYFKIRIFVVDNKIKGKINEIYFDFVAFGNYCCV